MDDTPAPSRLIPGPGNASVSVRLAVIEERLGEIIGHLDELNTNLVALLDRVQPN